MLHAPRERDIYDEMMHASANPPPLIVVLIKSGVQLGEPLFGTPPP